jgi:uncharacterized Zn finger protein (UPF0148 family)
MTEETVACCPECEATSVQNIKSGGYYCARCGAVVDTLDEREPRRDVDLKQGTVAALLDDADPDALDDLLSEVSRRD